MLKVENGILDPIYPDKNRKERAQITGTLRDWWGQWFINKRQIGTIAFFIIWAGIFLANKE